MSRFWPEPPFSHESREQTGILLVNLGTPEAPTAPALRAFLRQFLSDPRVVEIPRPVWWLILNLFVLTVRPAKSAEKYAKIWTPEGSPLKTHTELQRKLLRGSLGHAGHPDILVEFAMRYGQPSIVSALERMKATRCTRILLVPLYPQYAASTTASTIDELARALRSWRNLPEIRYVRSFHDHPGYIGALAASVRQHWERTGRGRKLLMSFHGLPRLSLTRGDPYHCECQKTGRLLAEELGLGAEEYVVTFQSRFGRAQWLQPYTQPTLEAYARQGVDAVDVICPGFVSDCVETLEEIALECKSAFLGSGGREFRYIPCLNERPEWISALTDIALAHLGHWTGLHLPDEPELLRRASRAREMGATS